MAIIGVFDWDSQLEIEVLATFHPVQTTGQLWPKGNPS